MSSILSRLRTYRTSPMTRINDGFIERIIPGQALEEGTVTLYGSTGIAYPTRALNVPGHGLVPCSRRLSEQFTNDSSKLVVVHSTKYVTSDIWVTLSN